MDEAIEIIKWVQNRNFIAYLSHCKSRRGGQADPG